MTTIIIGGIIALAVVIVGLVYAFSAVMPMLLDEDDDK